MAYSAWLAGELADIDVVSVHPGVIIGGLLHAMFGAGGAPVDEAASVLVDIAARPLESGAYYDEHEPAAPNPEALDRRNQQRLTRSMQAAIA